MIHTSQRWLAMVLALTLFASGETYGQVVLSVDRATGETFIRNDSATDAVNINGYSITSENGLLDDVGWSSFADSLLTGWNEVANVDANGLAEINNSPGGFVTINAGTSLFIGNAYTTDPSAAQTAVGFGNAFQDLSFRYGDADLDEAIFGGVDYAGQEVFNNLVLEIDVASGVAKLINESAVSVDIDFYQIRSPKSVLDAGFSGLTQGGNPVAGWETGGSNSGTGLAQFFPQPAGGFTVAGGEEFELGATFDPGNESRDVDFSFHIVGTGEDAFDGVVRFLEVTAELPGDFDGNGVVDGIDYAVWRQNLGSPDEMLISNNGDGSGTVDTGDFDLWVGNFGATGGAGSGAATPTPEPAGLLLLACSLLTFTGCHSRSR